MTDTNQTAPSIDVAGLLEGVLAALFGVAAQTSPPTLVYPVLGHVETRILGLWPAPTPTTPSTEQPAHPGAAACTAGLAELPDRRRNSQSSHGKAHHVGTAHRSAAGKLVA